MFYLFLEEVQSRMSPFRIQLNLTPQVLVEFTLGNIAQIQQVILIEVITHEFFNQRFIQNFVIYFGLLPFL